jgi:hypothetical protein
VPDLRLNSLVQDPVAKSVTPKIGSDKPAGQPGGIKTESITSGVVVVPDGASIGVDTTEEGEVDGTICDCGEIFIAGGGIPKWPFMLLAAVPVVFITECCDENPQSTPTPTPPGNPTPTPPPQVPEPASLLLFGSGLAAAGAGLRRRYSKTKVTEQTKEEE